MSATQTTFERIQDVFQKISAEPITEQTTLRTLYLDPLDLTDLIFGLEEEFKIQIADEEAERFRTVAEVAACVERLLREVEKCTKAN